jgi:hypothetical protein
LKTKLDAEKEEKIKQIKEDLETKMAEFKVQMNQNESELESNFK